VSIRTADAYARRFTRVFDYIDAHLGEELSVERLSRVANFSKFHFHRQFSEYAGISISRYVQLMRLKRASYRLVFSLDSPIIEIAMEAGFENPESFSRAFKKTFGQTPSQFRKAPVWESWKAQYPMTKRQRSAPMEVAIVEFEEMAVGVLEHRGAPETVPDSVRVFIEWRKQSGLSPVETSKTLGVIYHDPKTTEPADFRFDICGEASGDIPANPQGVERKVIPAGRCAVIRHLGAHDRMGECIYYLYREWLPDSGEEPRDFPLFCHYLNLLPETPEHELITDIYLPLNPR